MSFITSTDVDIKVWTLDSVSPPKNNNGLFSDLAKAFLMTPLNQSEPVPLDADS